jgi:hypothetical protein
MIYIETKINFMKNKIFLVSIILLCSSAMAQDYTPFNFEKGVWSSAYFYGGDVSANDLYQYFCKGDTIIDEIKYYKLYIYGLYRPVIGPPDTTNLSYYLAIRNNDKKIIVKYTNDTMPQILYDFNLNIGDTMINGRYTSINDLIVTKIDSIEICGKYHKRFFSQYNDRAYLIEGIGMNQCLFGIVGLFESTSEGCYMENGNSFCKDCDLLLSVKKIPKSINEIEIFPNPGNSELSIKTQKDIRQIYIYNILGQSIYKSSLLYTRTEDVNIDSFEVGTYFIKIEFYDKTFTIKPFIKN